MFVFSFQSWKQYHANLFRKIASLVNTNLLVCQVIEQTEDIKYNMRAGWINLITIERSLAESPFAKMPLISYSSSKGQVGIGNSENSDSKTQPLPSVMELMNILGYNIHRKSWQNTFLSEKPAHWDQITTLPWDKVANVLKVAGFFRKGFSAAVKRRALRNSTLNRRRKWTVAPVALRLGGR